MLFNIIYYYYFKLKLLLMLHLHFTWEVFYLLDDSEGDFKTDVHMELWFFFVPLHS